MAAVAAERFYENQNLSGHVRRIPYGGVSESAEQAKRHRDD